MTDKKLELVFIDKDGKFYPLDEVSSVELADGLKGFQKKPQKDYHYRKHKDSIY